MPPLPGEDRLVTVYALRPLSNAPDLDTDVL